MNIYFLNVKYSHDFTQIILLLLHVIANTELCVSVYPKLLSVTSDPQPAFNSGKLLKKKETKSIKINLSIFI